MSAPAARFALAVALCCGLLPWHVGDEAHAAAVPPQASLAGLSERVGEAVKLAREVGPALGVDPSAACDRLAASLHGCATAPLEACQSALIATYAALGDGMPSRDELSRGVAARVRSLVVNATARLASARAAFAAGACERTSLAGAVPTEIKLGRDGRLLRIRPVLPLRAGRSYALVAFGLAPAELAAARESVVPRVGQGGIEIPPGGLARPLEQALASNGAGMDEKGAAALVRRLEQEAAELPALGGGSGVQIVLPEPLRADQLSSFYVSFIPARSAPAGATVAVFATLEARRGLIAYRTRLAELSCLERPSSAVSIQQTLGWEGPGIAEIVRGSYPSLDVRGDSDRPPMLGVDPTDARPVELPYLLVLPKGWSESTPLVLGVDGHTGSARRVARRHAVELAERGLALLAIDLPEHGERGAEGKSFLDVLDPADLALNLRQSAVDVMAAVRAALHCGLVLPEGRRMRPREVLYVGYSLGAMVGTIARSVEPELGAAVLFTPGADLGGWLMLQVTPRFGAGYVTCLGGAQHGQSCFPAGICEAPGVCTVDPYTAELAALLDLPYALAAAGADPVEFAAVRTGSASHAPVLLLTGGKDAVLHPMLAARLSDAYGMTARGETLMRGPGSVRLEWPELGHDLVEKPEVRAVAHEFLLSRGHRAGHPAAAQLVDNPGPGR